MGFDLGKLMTTNAQRWKNAKLDPKRLSVFKKAAALLVAPDAKARYQSLEKLTNVPWFVIAVIHQRECPPRPDGGPSWNHSIAQGDRWDKVSVHVPRGRGPFTSWEKAGVDALVNCAPHASWWKDWSAGGTMTLLEKYNGLGYARMGRPSPYIWSGTDQYSRGKYIRDGVYSAVVVDSQLGCAGLLMAMAGLDSSIKIGA